MRTDTVESYKIPVVFKTSHISCSVQQHIAHIVTLSNVTNGCYSLMHGYDLSMYKRHTIDYVVLTSNKGYE